MNTKSNTEIRYRLLKLLENNPNLTQRQMAEEDGPQPGKVQLLPQRAGKKGYRKSQRFTTSDNKAGYVYLLTPRGINEKARITASFLKRKLHEYEQLKRRSGN